MAKKLSFGAKPTSMGPAKSIPWWQNGAPALIVRLSRMMGVAPLVIRPTSVDVSTALVIYGDFLMVAIQFCGIWSTVVMNAPTSAWSKKYGNTTHTTWLVERCILLFTNFIGAFFSSCRMKKWISLMERAAMMKMKLGDEIYSNAAKKTEFKVIVTSLLAFIALSGFDFYFYAHSLIDSQPDCDLSYTVMTLGPYYLLDMVQSLIEVQLLLTFWYVASLMSGVRLALKQLLENAETDRSVATGKTKKEFSYNKKLLSANDINSIYIEICELVDLMNERNGVVMFFILLNCVIHLTVFPYNVIDNVMSSQITLSILFVDLSWSIFHFIHIYIIVTPGHCLVKESQEVRILVGKLLSREWNADVSTELKKLYITLLLNKPTFSPLSVCVVSRELIVSIFGVVLTYLVILVQFETSEKKQNKEIIANNST